MKLFLCTVFASCHAYVLPTVTRHATIIRPAQSHVVACEPAVPEPLRPIAPPPSRASSPEMVLGKVKAWYMKYWKVDKAQLRALGVDAIFTYGVLSNMNVAMLATLSWFVATKATGLSPLVAGQWKYFISTYVGFYVSLGAIIRPFRVALTFTVTPLYSLIVEKIRAFLPLRKRLPKVNRIVAIFIVSIMFNVVGTFGLIALGASFAGLLTGVPPVPPGFSFGEWRAAEKPLDVMRQLKAMAKEAKGLAAN